MSRGFFLLTVLLLCASGAEAGRPEVSLGSLLDEMTDREEAARLPVPAYGLRQASSWDRASNDPWNPGSWFANTDHGQFLHTEMNQGRKEWVIMQADGPGAVTRFWTPLLADKAGQVIRFYLDGAPVPAIEANFLDLLRGQGFVKPPLAFTAWNESDLGRQQSTNFQGRMGVAGDLYLPIPFAKGCKITLDSAPFYYVINYRMYEPGTRVRSYSMGEFRSEAARLGKTSAILLAVAKSPAGHTASRDASLAPGAEVALDLEKGDAAVREVQVALRPGDAPQALRSLVLTANFDGEETVWCPVGEFFGAGVRLNPVRDWVRSVSSDGTLSARWVMPYRRTGRLALKNVGAVPLSVKFAATTGPWDWDERSLLFHSNWHCQSAIPTQPRSDWNYIELQGTGRYAGDCLSVFSSERAWYGEGDEKIYINGVTYPDHIGTGTEDYYGYAWGMSGFFSSPFISMPQRDHVAQDDWRGYTTTSRLRLLDGIPFASALKVDIEVWDWADTRVDYAAGTFWYARPGARHNRPPQPEQAAEAVRESPENVRITGALECESLKVLGHSPDLKIETQDTGLKEGQWSGGRQLFVQATNVGDYVELEVPAGGDQPRKLALHQTRSADYGILRFAVNGQTAGTDCDTYNPIAVAGGPVELGVFTPREGKFVLRIEVVGANPASIGKRYFFGLDCVAVGNP